MHSRVPDRGFGGAYGHTDANRAGNAAGVPVVLWPAGGQSVWGAFNDMVWIRLEILQISHYKNHFES